MSKTFCKRSGTTDKGKYYEILNLANITLNLVNDERIKDYQISSDSTDFGAFDDIVIECEIENDTEVYALQLKHSTRGNLSLKQLISAAGDFSIKKYFESVKTIQVVNTKFILYTNLKLKFVEGTIFYLDGENFPVTLTKICSKNVCKISHGTDYCYKFSIMKDGNYNNSSKNVLYEQFFEKFFLYVDQENTNTLRLRLSDKFKSSFCGDDVEFEQYINLLREWSLQEGTKEKLNKKWMQLAIALKVLSCRIKPLSFDDSNTVDPKIAKQNILREAVALFDITIFGKQTYDDLKNVWSDSKCKHNDLKILNKLRTNYQVDSTYISDIAKVNPLTLNILLWLMDECPLILTEDENIHKVLELCISKKIILLRDENRNSFPKYISSFKTLSDLKTLEPQYNRVVENFTCSLQGKKEILLQNLVKDKEDILTVLKTDDLLEMSQGKCIIGETKENLPDPYVERVLLKNAIDIEILENISKETVVILDSVSRKKDLQNRFKKCNFIDLNEFLNAEKHQTLSQNSKLGSDKNLSMESSSLSSTIYLSEGRCGYNEFNAVYNKSENAAHFHQFRFRHDGNLEWIRSQSDVNALEKYKLSNYYPVQECNLDSSEIENNINLLISDPGMGKSELMKSFKVKCFSHCFTVILSPKDVYSFLKEKQNSENYVGAPYNQHCIDAFQDFLLNEKYKMLSERDKSILRVNFKLNEIIYVWDALDELSDEHLKIVIGMIEELSKHSPQWVTSRCRLQSMLQEKFNVLSVNLNQFNENEQKNYIRKRLIDVKPTEKIELIIQKIESSFVLVEHKDILGIPLQLFMLTELFRQDLEKYLALLNGSFLLTDLYQYFIDEKISIVYREKLSIDLNTAYAEDLVQSQKRKTLKIYTNIALRLLYPDTVLGMLGVQHTNNFQKLQKSYRDIGLVTETKNQIAQFLHNSFAEYLAARYFLNTFESKENKPKFINSFVQLMFDSNYTNVRFFLDLLLAKNSVAHVAILYKNFSFIRNCKDEILKRKDCGGRSVLHLACSWSQRYPKLEIKCIDGKHTVDDDGHFSSPPESNEFLETVDYLLTKCDRSESDEIYQMSPKEYSQKSTCLVVEMKITMFQDVEPLIETDHIINMLYYSAHYGYYQEFAFCLELVKQNLVELEDSKDQYKFCYDALVNIKNYNGMTLLNIAAEMGHNIIVKILVKTGADINLSNKHGETPLKIASYYGYDKIVEILVKAGADINNTDNYGNSPLYLASYNGQDKVVEILVKASADINLANKHDDTPLKIASYNGHEKVVEVLVKADAAIDLANEHGDVPLRSASHNGHDKIVELLLKAGADINFANKYGETALKIASHYGHDRVVQILVKAGADINLANKYGDTPLKIASYNGHDKVAEVLVKAGAAIDLANEHGDVPLRSASHNGHDKIVKFLLKAGADINFVNKYGETALKIASYYGHDKVVEILVEAGAAIDLANEHGDTPLISASHNGHGKIVEFLVKSGANINFANKYGETALKIASYNGHEKVVEILVKADAAIDLANDHGDVPLRSASHNGHDKIVKFLLKAGADINFANKYGETALKIASYYGHDKVVEILVEAGAAIDLANEHGDTPLISASHNGHGKIVEFLVKSGANVNFANKYGETALKIASYNGHEKVGKILIKASADVNHAKKSGET